MELGRAVLFCLATSGRLERAVKTVPLGEAVAWRAADRVLEDYVELAGALPSPASEAWLSVDLTHLALDTDASSPADPDALADAGVHVRLVKGAYLEATGAHPHGEATDVAFLRLGFGLVERGATWAMATHDGRLREALLLAHGPLPVEQLFGVRPECLTGPASRHEGCRVGSRTRQTGARHGAAGLAASSLRVAACGGPGVRQGRFGVGEATMGG